MRPKPPAVFTVMMWAGPVGAASIGAYHLGWGHPGLGALSVGYAVFLAGYLLVFGYDLPNRSKE